ncbi:Coq4 family protein [uncultured Shewanella sp.]|uniref:Coq4 family protein n=1 Tax=uncultured Shewanella sp. TaxID=173975 RepID=UPI00261BE0E0|nr:Coq4 family protein [uncultured Shewanella sp.]
MRLIKKAKVLLKRKISQIAVIYYIFISVQNKYATLLLYKLAHSYPICRKLHLVDVLSDKKNHQIVKERTPVTIDLKKLKHLPKDSFGHQLYLHAQTTPLFTHHNNDNNDYAYIVNRLVVTHDIYHVLLDVDTKFHSEARIAGFSSIQHPYYLSPVINVCAGLIWCSLNHPHRVSQVIEEFIKGRIIGKAAKKVFHINWETLYEEKAEHVRAQLNIKL